jgi:ABC-2 type transport system permease protein
MRILGLAYKDLKQLFQNKMTAFFLLIMPVLFTLMFGFMFGGTSTGDEDFDPRLPVGVLDQDRSGFSERFVSLIETSTAVRVVIDDQADEDELRGRVQQGDLAAAVILPSGFEAQLLAGELPSILMVADKDAVSANLAVENELRTVYNRLFSAALAADLSRQAFQAETDFGSQDEAAAYFNRGVELALESWQTPPVQIEVEYALAENIDQAAMFGGNAYVHSSPGMMAQFAIAGLIGAAELLVAERRSRTMARMLTTRTSRWEILLGHYLAIFVMIFLQLVVLAGFGQLFLELNYFEKPLAVLMVIVTASMATGALGLLVGALAKTSDQAVILSLVPMFVFAGLGGAWVPLEYTNATVQLISKFTPVYWVMQGLQDILLRGARFGELWPAAAALLGFTGVFFALAVWRFRFEGA